MHSHVLTLDTATGRSLINQDVATDEMCKHMEPCSRVDLSFAYSTRVKILDHIHLKVGLNELGVPFYFSAMTNFRPKLLIGKTFCDRSTKTIKPSRTRITRLKATPLLIRRSTTIPYRQFTRRNF